MTAVLSLFWSICTLRVGPDRVPTNASFAAVMLMFNVVLATALIRHFDRELSLVDGVAYVFIAFAATATFTWLVLQLLSMGSRFLPTLTALIGCDLLLGSMLGLGLIAVMAFPSDIEASLDQGLAVGFQLWSIAVSGFILHRAFGISFLGGLAASLGFAILSGTLATSAIGV